MLGRLEASSELEGDVAAFGQVIRQFQWKAERSHRPSGWPPRSPWKPRSERFRQRRILILRQVEGILWDIHGYRYPFFSIATTILQIHS